MTQYTRFMRSALLCLGLLAAATAPAQEAEPIAPPEAEESTSDAQPASEYRAKPITSLGVEIGLPEGKLPKNLAMESNHTVPAGQVLLRGWPVMTYYWKASCTRHNPLYFEEVNAERYGYTCGHCLQPVVSTAHFFGTIPALPYLMASDCPGECVYTLGHYRPGNCNPWRRHCWPCRFDAILTQEAFLAGLILALP